MILNYIKSCKFTILLITSFLCFFSLISLAQADFKAPLDTTTVVDSEPSKQSPDWRVYFSPKGGCAQAIVDAIGQAKQSVLVQAYSFTSYSIAQALIDAKKRGVKVEVIIDKGKIHEKKTKLGLMAKGEVSVYLDGVHAIAHNKVMVIDNTVITGSFNFTNAAEEYNAENVLIVHDEKLADEYSSNWCKHREHSEAYRI